MTIPNSFFMACSFFEMAAGDVLAGVFPPSLALRGKHRTAHGGSRKGSHVPKSGRVPASWHDEAGAGRMPEMAIGHPPALRLGRAFAQAPSQAHTSPVSALRASIPHACAATQLRAPLASQAPAGARAWLMRSTPRLCRRVGCAGRRRPALWCRKPCVWSSFPSVSALQSRPRRPAGTAGKKRKSSRQPGMNEGSVTGQKQPGATSLNPVCHAALQTRLKTCRPAAHR
jgi:hypothetical protein